MTDTREQTHHTAMIQGVETNEDQAPALEKDTERKQLLHGLAFFGMMSFLMWVPLTVLYLQLHGVGLDVLFPGPYATQVINEFDFVGGPTPSPISLLIEIIYWSFFGVGIRIVYRVSTAIRRKRFSFFEYFVRMIGDMLLGFGVTTAVIFFLRITTISIAGAELNLAQADYETFAAITFILAFFYEDSLRLLRGFRDRIIASAGQESKEESEMASDSG